MSGGPRIRGDEATLAAEGIASTTTPSALGPALVGGRYTILGLVGVGGMGSVYRARDAELDEVVALKVLRKELVETPGMLERFRQEVKLARRVTHTNIARTFDIGEHEGEKFLTMEYVDGESLAELGGEGPMPASGSWRSPANLRWPVGGARRGRGAPRSEAGQHPHRQGRPPRHHRFRDRSRRPRGRCRGQDQRSPRSARPHTWLPSRSRGRRRRARGPLRPGRDALRADHGRARLAGRFGVRRRGGAPGATSARPEAAQPRPARGRRGRRPALHGQGARPALRVADEVARHSTRPSPLRRRRNRVAPPQPSAQPPPEANKHVPSSRSSTRADRDEYIADGLTEDLIETLARPGAACHTLGGHGFKAETDPREVGRQLGVQVVVEGTVRKAGESARQRAPLQRGRRLSALGKRYDCPESEFLAVADEAADAIAEAFTVRTSPRARRPRTRSPSTSLARGHAYHAGWSSTSSGHRPLPAGPRTAPTIPRSWQGTPFR